MSRKFLGFAFAALMATPGLAFAGDWHFCMANAATNPTQGKAVIWYVSPAFNAEGIADWQAQWEAAKVERRQHAASGNMNIADSGFACTEGFPDEAGAQARLAETRKTYQAFSDAGDKLGVPIFWQDWDWSPTNRSQAATEGAEQQAAVAEREHQPAEIDRKPVADQVRRQRELPEVKSKQEASTNTDATRCVSSPELRLNDTFEGNTAAYVSNGCGTPVDVRICLMRDNGWNCGMKNGLTPQASWSWSSFRATGKVFMDARVSGSGRQLLSP